MAQTTRTCPKCGHQYVITSLWENAKGANSAARNVHNDHPLTAIAQYAGMTFKAIKESTCPKCHHFSLLK